MKKNKLLKPILAVIALVLLVVIMTLVYNQFKPKTTTGSKEIVVEIITPEEGTKEFKLHTDAEYLGQALEEKQLIKGTPGEYGIFITEANGRVADESKQEWWCITKGGEDVYTGVDVTPIIDGDHYEITLTVGY